MSEWTRKRHESWCEELTKLPPAPWSIEVIGHTTRVVDAQGNDLALFGDCRDEQILRLATMFLILRNDLPDMLAEIERLAGEVMRLSKELEPDRW